MALSGGAHAQRDANPSRSSLAQAQRERASLQEVIPLAVLSPHAAELLDQATIQMTGAIAFLAKNKAGPLFQTFDLKPDTELVGVVYNTQALDWVGSIRFVTGFVRAESMLGWSADEILQNMRDAMQTENLDRATRGLPQRELRRWQEPPTYDPETHRLVWAALTVPKGGAPAEGETVYHAVAFGRTGYFHVEIPATVDQFEVVRADGATVLANLAFVPGRDYGAYAPPDPTARRGLDRLFGVQELRRTTVQPAGWDDEIVVPAIAGGILVVGALAIGIAKFLMIPRRRV
jgi:uncharacterized membrane-anchored protein